MKELILALLTERFADANALIREHLDLILERKTLLLKQVLGAHVSEEANLTEADVVRQGRVQLIRRRIRRGKLQRNIRRSAVKGFTLRRGKLKRIPASRRIHMRIVQRRAARKRKSHLQASLRKRKISLRKRRAMGIREETTCHTN